MFVRPSSQPTFHKCASSQEPNDNPYTPKLDVATLGTATHEPLEMVAEGRPYEEIAERIDESSRRFRCDKEEMTEIVSLGMRMWPKVSAYFPKVQTEIKLHADITGGTSDIVSYDKKHCTIGDWKTGHVVKDAFDQVLAYAYAFYKTHGMPEEGFIRSFVLWVRTGQIDYEEITEQDILHFAERHEKQVSMIGREYNPGQHCCFCQNSLKCDVYNSWMQQAIDLFSAKERDVGLAYEGWLCVKRQGERLAQIVKDGLSSGKASQINLPSGDVAKLVDTRRSYIDSRKAILPILEELTPEELAECVTIKKGSLSVDLQQKLSDAGAIKETVSKSLKIVRKEKQ